MKYYIADKETLDKIAGVLGVDTGKVIYGWHISSSEPDPSSKVTYLYDAKNMTPARMNFSNDTFEYGSWSNAFFMPIPVMLETNGTVAYDLNPNDYTKKANGEDSDVANTSFDGNAMMEWGRNGHIWWKLVPDKNDIYSGSFFVSNYQVDDSFHDWNYAEGKERFYTSIYSGSEVSGKMRSISGLANIRNKTAEYEMNSAKANGDSYTIEEYVDWLLINCLLILMGKSTDTQSVFGQGHCNNSYIESLMINTGTMNDKGLFWGETTGKDYGVKIFGMENFYGNQWDRLAGLILDKSEFKVKMTRDTRDGSSVEGYNITAEGYNTIHSGATTGSPGTHIAKMKFTPMGIIPVQTNGSSSTYYCDGFWFDHDQLTFAIVGGRLYSSSLVGGLYLSLNNPPDYADSIIGARLSSK